MKEAEAKKIIDKAIAEAEEIIRLANEKADIIHGKKPNTKVHIGGFEFDLL